MSKPKVVDLKKTDLEAALGLSGHVTLIPTKKLSKADSAVIRSNALSVENDMFSQFYVTEQGRGDLLRPTYNPIELAILCQQNNTLGQCVTAMEVNVDGTGFTVDKETTDGKETNEQDEGAKKAEGFFKETYPGESFTTLRRKTRRDLEQTGNGYWEVLRDQKGQIRFLRYLDAKFMRLAKLGEPVEVTKTVDQGDGEFQVKMAIRERRYAQLVGSKLRYFKEFGAARELDYETGKWHGEKTSNGPDVTVTPDKYATEVIHFMVEEDVLSPYGVPRWVNQLPSVLGSRKAEEYNLTFFDHGGVPPAMILVQGGQLSQEARASLTNYLAGKAKFKQRGVLIEAFSTSGDLASAGNVRISVERFGAEKQNDSMFEMYDKRCFERVRSAFRLPPMFLGHAEDYNFATAYTTYMVAEAQVFKPERDEFDGQLNLKLMKTLFPGYVFRSLPLQVKDVETMLKGLELAKGQPGIEAESWLNALNELLNLKLDYEEPPEAPNPVDEEIRKLKTLSDMGIGKEGTIAKTDDGFLTELATDWASHLSGEYAFEPESVATMQVLVKSMQPPLRKLFNAYVGMKMVPGSKHDPNGVAALVAGAGDCLHANGH